MSKKILVVDDEREWLLLLRWQLELLGCEIIEASSPSEILERIKNESFDLVLLDFGMPDITGDKICRMIREGERSKNTPVIFVTAYSQADEDTFKFYGANDVVYKPINHEELIQKVKKHLGIGTGGGNNAL